MLFSGPRSKTATCNLSLLRMDVYTVPGATALKRTPMPISMLPLPRLSQVPRRRVFWHNMRCDTLFLDCSRQHLCQNLDAGIQARQRSGSLTIPWTEAMFTMAAPVRNGPQEIHVPRQIDPYDGLPLVVIQVRESTPKPWFSPITPACWPRRLTCRAAQ